VTIPTGLWHRVTWCKKALHPLGLVKLKFQFKPGLQRKEKDRAVFLGDISSLCLGSSICEETEEEAASY
jgi:hypothetical protein